MFIVYHCLPQCLGKPSNIKMGVNWCRCVNILIYTFSDWILKLGPETFGSGQYQYSIVSGGIRAQLFVLARDVAGFKRDYEAEVLKFLQDQGFTHFYNKPVKTYHASDCLYNSKHQ